MTHEAVCCTLRELPSSSKESAPNLGNVLRDPGVCGRMVEGRKVEQADLGSGSGDSIASHIAQWVSETSERVVC